MNSGDIIQRAIQEEQLFVDFYTQAAERADLPSARQLLERLAGEEKKHKARLQGIDLTRLPENLAEEVDIAQDLTLTPVNEFRELKDIFKYAIQFEKDARSKYRRFAKAFPDEHELFDFLAQEEEMHEQLLTAELEKLGI